MSLSKSNYILNESIDIKEGSTPDVAILFTDMVGSSDAWKKDPDGMIDALEEQSIMVDKKVKTHKGFICKTIGDAFMISFKNPEDALKCAIDIQEELKNNPIKIGKLKNTVLRIGICYGPVYESVIKIQNISLKDYFGNTVNTAARLESKVAEEGGVAIALMTENAADVEIAKILEPYKVNLITFGNKGDEVKRSARTLTDIHRHIYKNIDELKGVDKLDVFNIKL